MDPTESDADRAPARVRRERDGREAAHFESAGLRAGKNVMRASLTPSTPTACRRMCDISATPGVTTGRGRLALNGSPPPGAARYSLDGIRCQRDSANGL
jgi:hypothetical protein